MILLDFSQIAVSSVHAFSKELIGKSNAEIDNAIRHMVLSAIKSYKKKYHREYGEFIICTDGKNYWRKDKFEYYKAGRKKLKEKSELNWDVIMECIGNLRDDIKENFPYKVLHLDHTEADDIIAVLCKWSQNNNLVQDGIFTEKQKVLIISSDGDFKQLHKYDNVKQYSPKHKNFIKISQQESLDYLHEHILRGDVGDGIPSIFCPSDFFVNKQNYPRAKSITVPIAAEFIKHGKDACKTDIEKENWDRNEELVSFTKIPKFIDTDIIDLYNTYIVRGDKNKIMNYLIAKKCRLLIQDLEDF